MDFHWSRDYACQSCLSYSWILMYAGSEHFVVYGIVGWLIYKVWCKVYPGFPPTVVIWVLLVSLHYRGTSSGDKCWFARCCPELLALVASWVNTGTFPQATFARGQTDNFSYGLNSAEKLRNLMLFLLYLDTSYLLFWLKILTISYVDFYRPIH